MSEAHNVIIEPLNRWENKNIMNLQLEPKHYQIIQKILSKHPYQFYAYGSRAKGTAKKFSDLDLCYYDDVPLSVISQIEEEFTESNLPFEVELVNWKHMRPTFQEMIKEDLVELKKYEQL